MKQIFDLQVAEFDQNNAVWNPSESEEVDKLYLALRDKIQTMKIGYSRLMALRFLQASRFWIKVMLEHK